MVTKIAGTAKLLRHIIVFQKLCPAQVVNLTFNNVYSAGKNRANRRRDDGERHRQMKENLAISQLALIVGSFAIGYLPTTSKNAEQQVRTISDFCCKGKKKILTVTVDVINLSPKIKITQVTATPQRCQC